MPADDRVDGYLYGGNDFIDAQVLRFLRTDDVTASALVREHPDDLTVARTVVERSGRSPEECRAFSTRFRRTMFDFIPLETDEKRMAPGLKRSVISFPYNATSGGVQLARDNVYVAGEPVVKALISHRRALQADRGGIGSMRKSSANRVSSAGSPVR